MYYQEKIINDVLHFKLSPKDDWMPYSAKGLTQIILKMREQVKNLEKSFDKKFENDILH